MYHIRYKINIVNTMICQMINYNNLELFNNLDIVYYTNIKYNVQI